MYLVAIAVNVLYCSVLLCDTIVPGSEGQTSCYEYSTQHNTPNISTTQRCPPRNFQRLGMDALRLNFSINRILVSHCDDVQYS